MNTLSDGEKEGELPAVPGTEFSMVLLAGDMKMMTFGEFLVVKEMWI